MTKNIKLQIMWASVILITVLVLGYLGIFALQKSMTIKMGFNVEPNIRCEIWMHTNADGQVGGEDVYNKIFSNKSGEEYIATNVLLNETTGTLTLPNNFRGGIGAGFDLKIYNYTTNTPIFVSSQGEGVSLHSVVCAGFVSSTPTPQILSVNSATNTANIVFETEFYEVSFNNPALSFDNANSSVAEFDGNYYISAGQQLTGNILNDLSYFVINSIQINTTTYNSTQIATWRTENILTMPNNTTINGNITINATTYHRVAFNLTTLSFSTSNTVVFDSNNYLQSGQQLSGTITTSASGNIIIHTIYIGETEYNYSQIYSWINSSNVLTIPNTIAINGDITINGYIGAYTRLSYLQTTGTQYINTGVYLNYLARVDIGLSLYAVQPPNLAKALFGARSSLTNKSYCFWSRDDTNLIDGKTWFHYRYSDSSKGDVFNINLSLGIGHIMSKNGNNNYVDGNNISSSSIAAFTTEYAAYLGTINTAGEPDNRRFIGNLLFCKIWANGTTPSRDFIPVLRTSDSKPGMLDLVNNVFYTNAGTGEFEFE